MGLDFERSAAAKKRRRQPKGTPYGGRFAQEFSHVGKATMDVTPSHKKKYIDALSVLDALQLHTLPKYRPLYLSGGSPADASESGSYIKAIHTIQARGDTKEEFRNSVWHEYGHYMSVLLGGGNQITEENPVAKKLFEQLRSTEHYKALDRLSLAREGTKVSATFPYRGKMRSVQLAADPKFATYMKGSDELFARAFAQYVGVKAGSSSDKLYLKKRSETDEGVYGLVNGVPYQFSESEFAPMIPLFDELFDTYRRSG